MAGRDRRVAAVGAVLAGLLAAVVFNPGIVFAADNGPCQAPVVNTHAYGRSTVNNVGAEATISFFSETLCSPSDGQDGSFSYVSTEIPGTGDDILQIGLAKCRWPSAPVCTGGVRWFYAWGRTQAFLGCSTGKSATPTDLGAAQTGLHTFTVYRSTSQVVFQIDGVTKATIGISNVSCWSATDVTVSGEVWDLGDQLGGSVATHQHFTNTIYEGSVNGSWSSPSFTTCSTENASYDCSRVNGQAIDIWTDRS